MELAAIDGSLSRLQEFENEVRQSRAVIAKKWGTVCQIVEQQTELFKTFYRQVVEDGRQPEDNGFDTKRKAVDASFFPYYEESIVFCALSLSKTGDPAYGDCHFSLRDASIGHRTTVFEENTLVFCERRKIPIGNAIPPGYRTKWPDRHRLAIAKLHAKVQATTTSVEFPGVLLKTTQNGSTGDADFVEVHIYGILDLKSVASFVGPKQKSAPDKILAKRVRAKLEAAGVTDITFG